MIVSRDKAPESRTRVLARELASLRSPCVGCSDCKGLCNALIEALILPDLILAKGQGG